LETATVANLEIRLLGEMPDATASNNLRQALSNLCELFARPKPAAPSDRWPRS
jgi:hypothetical protein